VKTDLKCHLKCCKNATVQTMAKKPTKAEKKIGKVMKEYKEGTLHSGKPGKGKGPTVKSRKQAIAIALSEAGKARKPKGKK